MENENHWTTYVRSSCTPSRLGLGLELGLALFIYIFEVCGCKWQESAAKVGSERKHGLRGTDQRQLAQ